MQQLLLLLLFISSLIVSGQPEQSALLSEEERNLNVWFDSQTQHQSPPIYDGVTYPLKRKARYGHPFFGTGQWSNGSLKYQGIWYPDVSMLYDLSLDQLITQLVGSNVNFGIEVDMKYVDQFLLGDNYFIKVDSSTSKFYCVLFVGSRLTLLSKTTKEYKTEPDGVHVNDYTDYYIVYQDQLIQLKNKGSLKQTTADAFDIMKKIKSRESKFDIRNPERLINFIKRFDEHLE